jgi:DNA polymerase I-like protein with 3'-5' exonuclease and polymerase domains
VSETMCGAFELSVPLAVSFGTGRTWEEAGH